MPTRPGHPCNHPGCPAIVRGAARYCEAHAAKYAWKGNRRHGEYGPRWRKLRNAILAREPLCRPCRELGRITAAAEVDHITPKSAGGTDATDNLQPICKRCHTEKTQREARRAKQCESA